MNVAAVVVTHQPNAEDLRNLIENIIPQVSKTFIINNSSDLENIQRMTGAPMKDIEIVSLGENYGIGKAHNVGIKMSINAGFDATLLLDQDSLLPEGLVSKLIEKISLLKQSNIQCATIGPKHHNRDTGAEYVGMIKKTGSQGIYRKNEIISSGSLILHDVFLRIGGFEEDLFIDNVDFEWCWRAKTYGYPTYLADEISMGHRVGEGDINFIKIIKLQVPAPNRHYYRFRNTILLMKRSYTPLYFKIRSLILMSIELVVFTLLVKPKKRRFKMICRGIIDGVLGRKGKMIE